MTALELAAIAYVRARDEYVKTYYRQTARQLLDAAFLELRIAVGECSTDVA